jgi:hypothetical protein
MMRCSILDIYNATRKLSRFTTLGASGAHMKAMLRVIEYCVATEQRGLKLDPNEKFSGDPNFKLVILGRSDSYFMKDPDTRRSVSGNITFLCRAPVVQRRNTQKIVALLVTEAELCAATSNAQDMMYAKRILELIKLKVEPPMILEMDNKGAVDLVNDFSVGGRTRHMDTKQYYLIELKAKGILVVRWKAGADMITDIFTNNLPRPDFERHA